MQTITSAEYRCDCGKLLFKGVLRSARIQVKCKRCAMLMSFGQVSEGHVIASAQNPRYQILKVVPLVLRDAISENKIVPYELVAEIDADGVCTYASKELADFLGKEVAELLGSNIFDLFPTGDRSDYREWFTEMLPTQYPYSLESVPLAHSIGKSAEESLVSVRHTPLYRDDGSLRGYSLVFEKC